MDGYQECLPGFLKYFVPLFHFLSVLLLTLLFYYIMRDNFFGADDMVVYIVTRHNTVCWIKSMVGDDVVVLPHLGNEDIIRMKGGDVEYQQH